MSPGSDELEEGREDEAKPGYMDKREAAMRYGVHGPSGRRGSWAAAGACLTAALLVLAGCGDGEAAPGPGARGGGPPGAGEGGAPGARATPVSVRVAEAGDLEVTLRASTTLRARERVDVVPKQTGMISEIRVEEGERVAEGAVLARLDDAEWRYQAEQAEARARAAREAVERGRALRELDLMSDQEVESLASDAQVAESEVALARLRVENASIRSPIAGTITHRFIERGQQVNTSDPVFGVADMDRLQAQLAVPEREIHRVEVGQLGRILTEEGGQPVAEGRVERIRPVVEEASGTVLVTVALEARSGDQPLRPGQFVNVDLVTETLTGRITLPRTSVLVDGAAPRVFLARGGVAEEREVTLGYSRGERVEIRSGLEPGDTVVVVGQDNLRGDAAVRVMQIDGDPIEAGPRAVEVEAEAGEGQGPQGERSPPEGGQRPTGEAGGGGR